MQEKKKEERTNALFNQDITPVSNWDAGRHAHGDIFPVLYRDSLAGYR